MSIAMATYNGGRYLREQLDSLCEQTVPFYELIISDDCSTDSTVEIINDYVKKFNVKLLTPDNNLGPNKNFENAIRACEGDYIMICDQDDIWMNGKISTCLHYIHDVEYKKGNDTPILISSETICFNDNNGINYSSISCEGVETNYLYFILKNLRNQGCTLMMNRALAESLGSFPSLFQDISYDSYIATVATLIGERCHIHEPLMYYRNHSNNVIGKAKKYTLYRRFLNKISEWSFNLSDCSEHHLSVLERVYKEYSNSRIEPNRSRFIKNVVVYFHSGTLRKVSIVANLNELEKKEKVVQIIKILLTTPIRFFMKHPRYMYY